MLIDALRHAFDGVERAIADGPIVPEVGAAEIRAHLRARYRFEAPMALADAAADAEQMLRRWQVQVTHPRYFGLFNPSVTLASVVADTLVAMYNPQLANWRTSPAANEIERHTLGWLAAKFGLPPESIATFTSGGMEANLSAVVVALTRAFPEYGEGGLRALAGEPVVYLTEESHHGFNKIAHMCGLGRRSLRLIATDSDLRMDVEALRQQLEQDRSRGALPFLVVANAGTTGTGVIDPLPAIAALCREHGLWFHVDAAWGGAAILSPTLRHHLAGIEAADSITCDAHKWFSVAMGAGMFFCRHRGAVAEAFRAEVSYMPSGLGAEDTFNPLMNSAQWSRRFIGLKLFLLARRAGRGRLRRADRPPDAHGRTAARVAGRLRLAHREPDAPAAGLLHAARSRSRCIAHCAARAPGGVDVRSSCGRRAGDARLHHQPPHRRGRCPPGGRRDEPAGFADTHRGNGRRYGAAVKQETIAIHGGYEPEPTTKAVAVPIYQTVAYAFDSADHAAALFNLEAEGFRYTRIQNPTTAVLERRVAALEGGLEALCVASGQAATAYAVQNVATLGTNIVSVPQLYGTTHTLFAHLLRGQGVTVRFAESDSADAIARLIDPDTRAVFCESVGNPAGNICDIEALARVAHDGGVPLIVDNTVATPVLLKPIDHGADIVVNSLTKFLGGHGTTLGGAIIDSGNFDWAAQAARFPQFTEPDASYHGMVYTAHFGRTAYLARCRSVYQRTTGAVMAPLSAFLLLQGIETVALRVERHVENARRVAEFLRGDPRVAYVNYAGFPESPYHALAQKYLGGRACSLMAVGIRGGYEAAVRFHDSLHLFTRLVNLGDAKSLVCHPASTTHRQMSREEQRGAGVEPEMIRLSIGIEHIDDILEDLDQALAAVAATAAQEDACRSS